MKRTISIFFLMLLVCNITYADIGGGTVHFIVFADTEDASIGNSCNQTLKYLQTNLLVKLRRYLDDKDVRSYIYEGNGNFTRSKLNAALSSLNTSTNDVILFYYTGHGFNNGSNDYPTLTLGRDGEDLSLRKKELLDIYNTLRAKSHRLLVVMAEACNKQATGTSISDNSPFEDDGVKFRNLFAAAGDYMISSSKKGQASYSQAGSMGLFSRSFADAMTEIVTGNNQTTVSWSNLFRLISQKTVQRAAQLKITQNPQWLQGSYVAGGSTIYQSQTTTPPATTTTTPTTSKPTSTTYTPYKRYKRAWNSPEEPKIIGIALGYVTKQWAVSQDGRVEKMGYWEDKNHLNGVQVGIRVEPQFKYGFALNTGLYYEYYFSKTQNASIMDEYDNPLSCNGKLQEHNLYLPAHLEYRLHFSEKFKIFFFGGVGFDYGLGGSIKFTDIPGYEDNTFDDVYAQSWAWKRFNTSLEYGGGIHIHGLQIHATLSKGLINMAEEGEAKVKMNKNLSVGISYMF
ncbi:MAG: PorT family protein [Bacteroides sp.]|nr:PorT family protein [Bacteroides sp.]